MRRRAFAAPLRGGGGEGQTADVNQPHKESIGSQALAQGADAAMQDHSAPSLLWVNHFAVGPDDGGGTRHFELARELTRLGWRVTIAASDFNLQSRTYSRRSGANDRRMIRESIEGVGFVWLWTFPYKTNNWRRALNWLSFSRGLRALRDNRFDIVLGSTPHLFAASGSSRLARSIGTPFVLEVRDLWPESLVAAGGRRGAFYHLLAHIAQRLYRAADSVVVFAEGVRDYLKQRKSVECEIAVIPNGVDPSAFHDPQPSSSRETTFVYAGAHGPANNLETVLGAAELLRERTDIRFLLVGDGPHKSALVADAEGRGLSNVTFRPPVPKTAIPAVLGDADVALMVLKDSELFRFGVSPNKLFDYFAASLPVLCNVQGEIGRLVETLGAGMTVEAGSAEALAEGARSLADAGRSGRLEMGKSGRAWVERERSRPVLAARLDAALRRTWGRS